MTATAGAVEADGPVTTTYRLSQRIRYDYSSAVKNLSQRLMVVPPANHGHQRRMSWSLRIKGATDATWRTGRDRFGNVVVFAEARRVRSYIEFAVDTDVTRRPGRLPHRVRSDAMFVQPTRLTTPDDAILRVANQAKGDPARLCHLVHGLFVYEYGITSVATTAAEAVAIGRGVCQDYAHVMIAAARATGIPARYVSGHLVGDGGSHAWVEILRPDESRGGWIVEAWDPTHDRPTAANYLTIAIGRDYSDVAPMSGTYSGAADAGALTVRKVVSMA